MRRNPVKQPGGAHPHSLPILRDGYIPLVRAGRVKSKEAFTTLAVKRRGKIAAPSAYLRVG